MSRYFALIPAAGSGSRLGGAIPKQYLPLAGKPMILRTIDQLTRVKGLAHVFVLLAPDDEHWAGMPGDLPDGVSVLRCGGTTRAATVQQGLESIAGQVQPDDWILVHDAARPCVDPERIEAMMSQLGNDAVGGLLALKVPDTIKRGNDDGVVETVSRENLWLAQTPQMFRYGLLRQALERSPADGITDEAQAIEAMGLMPRLVPSDASNLKVTYLEDLALAEAILLSRAGKKGRL